MRLEEALALIEERHGKRRYLDRPVPRRLLERVLAAAANAPSSRNLQPWRVTVLSGAARDELSRRLVDAYDRGEPTRPDYLNSPPDGELPEEWARRAHDAGAGLFAVKGVDRGDAEARRLHTRENYLFFGAPVEMILHLPPPQAPGSYLSLGLFLQNVMLALVAAGLGSCPQYSVAGYAAIVRDFLALPPGTVVVCGLAVGHPDPRAAVNRFHPERLPLAEYASFLDGEADHAGSVASRAVPATAASKRASTSSARRRAHSA